jgi:hypothetical protein
MNATFLDASRQNLHNNVKIFTKKAKFENF